MDLHPVLSAIIGNNNIMDIHPVILWLLKPTRYIIIITRFFHFSRVSPSPIILK